MDTPILQPMKRCTKCENEFPATKEYFNCDRAKKDGLAHRCKECNREHYRNYYQANKDKLNAKRLAYKRANPEKALEWRKTYETRNAEAIRQAKREAYRRNPEKQLARCKARHAAYPEKRRAAAKAWEAKNRLKVRTYNHKKRLRRANAEGNHTPADVLKQYASQKGRCWWCGCKVGEVYHVDHVIALAKGGTNDARNIVIACPKCNMSKGSKLPHEWNGRLF